MRPLELLKVLESTKKITFEQAVESLRHLSHVQIFDHKGRQLFTLKQIDLAVKEGFSYKPTRRGKKLLAASSQS